MLLVAGQSQSLIADFLKRWTARENPGPLDPLNVSGAFFALLNAMGADRETVMETQTAIVAGLDGPVGKRPRAACWADESMRAA